MTELIKSIFHDLGSWKKQVIQLALITVRKQTQNTFLGWLWLLVKPAMYIFCFWFALYIGIRGGSSGMNATQYLVWLTAGLMPWFFLQDTINSGSKVFSKYKYLVNKLKFPVALIPVFYELSVMLVHFLLLAVLFIMYFIVGGSLDIYFVQIIDDFPVISHQQGFRTHHQNTGYSHFLAVWRYLQRLRNKHTCCPLDPHVQPSNVYCGMLPQGVFKRIGCRR